MKTTLYQSFASLPDPRIKRNKKHLLSDILILTILGVICGAESWDSIELFGNTKIDFLKTILKLPNGIPSHDTINRVFSMLKPDKFEELFVKWTNTLKNKDIKADIIAIDGKTVRGSKDTYNEKSPIHLVSAWANKNQMVLGQFKTDCKSNEITAIPKLLEMLDIEGCIITIDAMGTQTAIAKDIIDKKADYVLALKGNQKELREEVESIFVVQQPESNHCVTEKGHGRIETRKCEVIRTLDFLEGRERWANLSSIIRITSERTIREKTVAETRYYISSLNIDAEPMNSHIRMHWGVENSLHWTLDMIFGEDQQRKREGAAAQNFALIQKIALNLLKKDTSKGSLKSKRLRAGWDNKFLFEVLKI
jgi:predicted transposase YbfD/YdcC